MVLRNVRSGFLATSPLALFALSAPALANEIYVDDDATGASDGSSWNDAFTDLQDALAVAQNFDEIWLAEGLYRPSVSDRTRSFTISGPLAIYGGFVGTEDSVAARSGSAAATILSGDLAGDDGADFTNRSDNSLHVVMLDYFAPGRLDRLTVRGGHADLPGHDEGGGVLSHFGPTDLVVDCIITDNYAVHGGGVFSTGLPSARGCVFVGNRALERGGALVFTSWESATPYISHCRFIDNEVVGSPDGEGGAVWGGWGDLVYCEFIGNRAPRGGALLWSGYGWGLTIVGNSASQATGGAVLEYTTLRSSILWGNSDPTGFSEAAQVDVPIGLLNESCVQGWTGAMGGARNFAADPMFVDVTGPDGIPGTLDDDLGLQRGSPCIDRGEETYNPSGLDLRGQPRLVDSLSCGEGGVIDMGAIERQEIDVLSSYCDAAPSSLGVPARITSPCTLSLFLDRELALDVQPVPNGLGIFVINSAPGSASLGDGFTCLAPGFLRIAHARAAAGHLRVEVDLDAPRIAALLVPGTTWYVQALYRDLSGGSAGFNLSDAASLEIRN